METLFKLTPISEVDLKTLDDTLFYRVGAENDMLRFQSLSTIREYSNKYRFILLPVSENQRLSNLISSFPENYPLYKDSGLWQMRSDDMEEVLFYQDVNQSFEDFIACCLYYIDKENTRFLETL